MPPSAIQKHATKALQLCTKWQEAVQILHGLERQNVTPDAYCFTAAITVCARTHAVIEGERLFHHMQDIFVQPTVATYNTLLTAYARDAATMWQRALTLLNTMPHKRVSPDAVSYNACVSACAKAPRCSSTHALTLFHQMQSRRIDPTQVTYNAMLAAFADRREWEQALNTLVRMPDPDVISYTSAIAACEDNTDAVVQLLGAMHDRNIVPNERTYTSAVRACGRNWQLALQLAADMRTRTMTTATSTSVIFHNALLAVLPRDMAEKYLLTHMKARDVVSYNTLLTHYMHDLHWERALSLLSWLLCPDAPNAVMGRDYCDRIEPDVYSFNTTLASLAPHGKVQECEKLLRAMGSRADAISVTCVIQACGVAHNWQKAEALYEQGHKRGWWSPKPRVVESNALEVDFHDHRQPVAVAGLRWVLHTMEIRSLIVVTGQGIHRPDGADGVLKTVLWDAAVAINLECQRVQHNEGRFVVCAESWKRYRIKRDSSMTA